MLLAQSVRRASELILRRAGGSEVRVPASTLLLLIVQLASLTLLVHTSSAQPDIDGHNKKKRLASLLYVLHTLYTPLNNINYGS